MREQLAPSGLLDPELIHRVQGLGGGPGAGAGRAWVETLGLWSWDGRGHFWLPSGSPLPMLEDGGRDGGFEEPQSAHPS